MKRKLLFVGLALVAIQTVFWQASGSEGLVGNGWPALVLAQLDGLEDPYLPPCIAVTPEIFAAVPSRLRRKVRERLSVRGVELRVAEPTHSEATGGYLDRECIEYFLPPPEWAGWSAPFIAEQVFAYYTYDWNGDSVLLAQLGPRWIHIYHWNRWF